MQATPSEELLQEAAKIKSLTTEPVSVRLISHENTLISLRKHGIAGTEAKLIDGVNAASSEHPAPAINVTLSLLS